ncbi:MAG: FapA family protein, partial [Endomicrobium sp.]|nr:FapA family protein [Endomicrobium sp.]
MGGFVRNGTSSFNTVNVFSSSKLNISGGISGGRVTNDGISMNNSVNVYGNITTQGNVDISGGYVHGDGSADSNRVNISGNIEAKGNLIIYGGNVNGGGSSNDNRVNISGNIEAKGDLAICGGNVNGGGSSNDNRVNISGNIEAKGNLTIYGGHVNGGGSSNDNRVNISGNIESEGNIFIVGAEAEHTAGNIVSISGKIAHTEISTKTVTIIAGSEASKSGVNNKVIIYETAEIPNTCILYGNLEDIQGDGNSLEIFFNKMLEVRTVGRFQNYKFTLLEGIKAGDTILSFYDSDAWDTSFNVEDVDIKILLSPKTGLNVGDKVLMHCDRGFEGSVSSV